MTDTMNPQFTDAEDQQSKIIHDIEKLQEIEKQLYNHLEHNGEKMSKNDVSDLIEKINSVSSMRVNLYNVLGSNNKYFQSTFSNTSDTLADQTFALNIVEKELTEAKQRLELLQEEKYSKFRLVEINRYYSDKYAEHSELMILLIYILVPLTIATFVYKSGIINWPIYFWIVVIILSIGLFFLIRKLMYMRIRDNMNYQEYDWKFNAPKKTTTIANNTDDPWLGRTAYNRCASEVEPEEESEM
jgi:hypothetical protein